MKKTYSVFIEVEPHELLRVLHAHFKRTGMLKDIPNDADYSMFSDETASVEYKWEATNERT